MKRASLVGYFYNGFFLANQSLDILLVGVLLFTPSLIDTYVTDTIFKKFISLLALIFLLINLGFNLSMPVFLVHKQQKTSLSYRKVASIAIANTRRILLSIFACILLFGAFIFLSLVILSQMTLAFFQELSVSGNGWHVILLVLVIVWSFFEFASFFFSLERNGFFTSLKKSLIAAYRNPSYIALIILFRGVSYSILSFIPTGLVWGSLLRIVLGVYGSIVLVASSLFYYQDVIKQEPFFATSAQGPGNQHK